MSFENRPYLAKPPANKATKTLVCQVNKALQRLVPDSVSLTDLNQVTFAAGLYCIKKLYPDKDVSCRKQQPRTPQPTPRWKQKLQKQITIYRQELSQIKQHLRAPNEEGRLQKKIKRIHNKYHTKDNEELNNVVRELEGKIPALAKRIRNQEEKKNSKAQNQQFGTNPKNLYRTLIRKPIIVERPPEKQQIEDYWRPLFENDETHNQTAQWLEDIKEINEEKPPMPETIITTEKVAMRLKHFANHKKPGIDKVSNFWLKQLTALHQHYSNCFNRLLKGNETAPSWLMEGDTSLIPKTTETQLPKKYRPICCLTTTYKLFTGLIADSIYDHLSSGNYLEKEQTGCRRSCFGTKDQLLLNKTILEDCRKRQRNLSMAWIDYQKAFDSVPHSWLIQCLELYKVHPTITRTLASQIPMWQTNISLRHTKGTITIPKVKIKRGIFQGDSLSPLLFCMAIDPLSKLLNKSRSGYNLSQTRQKDPAKTVNHLLFMDDLKLYASSDAELHQLLQVVSNFSNDIRMKFGLDKCAKCTLRAGKKTTTENIQLDEAQDIRELTEQEPYKYLGIEENDNIQHANMRKKAGSEYLSRLKKICKTQLTNKNKITAINQLAMPVLSYSFGIIDWPQTELNKLDIKTRKILTLHRVIYRNQCLPRLYMPRREGGLGLSEINHQHRATMVSTAQYLRSSLNPNIAMVHEHHSSRASKTTSITNLAQHFGQDCLVDERETENTPATKIARKSRMKYSRKFQKNNLMEWAEHQRAKYFLQELSKDYIDKENSLNWLTRGTLHFDQERLIMAAQDQGIMTNAFKKMAGLTNDNKCRFCHTETESVSHLISSCQTLLADGYYTARHDGVCKYLHWTICKSLNIKCSSKVWEHQPERITGSDRHTIYYDKVIPTATYLENAAVKPDLVIWDKAEKRAMIIEVSVPHDSGLNRAEREKVTKYQGLMHDMRRNWNLKEISIVPVISGATGLQKKTLKNHLLKIPGKPRASEIQTIALKGTTAILKRTLGCTL